MKRGREGEKVAGQTGANQRGNDASECMANLPTAASRQLLMFSLPLAAGFPSGMFGLQNKFAENAMQVTGDRSGDLKNAALAAVNCA